ncbi:MAG: 23S rRNA (uracil(1939)-C(5))-methyltransferase RlmD [Deltaproteobacteria bacterium]|nr:23S rRNA (uracil(1939)-C(5))-methyltransferase RlmD [Deltaproteobacteria bacterium]
MQKSSENSKKETNNSNQIRNGMVLELTIEQINADGFGIAREGDFTVQVADTAPGDRVIARVEHVSHHSGTAWARPLQAPQRGDKWKRHFCKESQQAGGRCGGCPLGHITRDVYKQVKLDTVADAFVAEELQLIPATLHCGVPKHYRNKSNFVVNRNKKGLVQLGSFAPRSHRFAPMQGCHINAHAITRLQREIQTLFEDNQVPVHPAPSGIRYVTIKAFSTGALLVDVVVNDEEAQNTEAVAQALLDIPDVHGVSVTCNPEKGNQLRHTSSHLHMGKNALCDRIADIQLRMKATTFFQLNNEIAAVMYQRAAEWCASAKTVWDLYCGIGGLGLTVAKSSGAVLYGCDSVDDAIDLAAKNAKTNQIDARFTSINLNTSFPSNWPAADVILVNPPRRGIDAHTMEQLGSKTASQLIYMSCNPTSFARDAQQLAQQGYILRDVEAFDMLPNTSHVELLGRFERGTK